MARVSKLDIEYTSSVLLDLSPEISMKCYNSNISRPGTCIAGVRSTPISNNTMNHELKLYTPNTSNIVSSL